MDDNFLLETETSRILYNAVKNEPVYDYHCHLLPEQIAENKHAENLADAWLCADHYKWRMMRTTGIDEKYITGNAPAYEKFIAWVRTLENLIGNPLYHWTHLELQRYFDIHDPLCEKNAPIIWEKANAMFQTQRLSVKEIFNRFNIHTVGTTDDPADSLDYHRAITEGIAPIGKIQTKIIPTFRPDKALDINEAYFIEYIDLLSQASNINIRTIDDLLAALENRLDFFISLGCRSADHALEYVPCLTTSVKNTFKKAMSAKMVSEKEADSFKTIMLISLANLYAKKNIAMQLHISVCRNTNTKMLCKTGYNTGFDAINDRNLSENLVALFDQIELESVDGMPKTILYTLNPKDYYPLASIMGSFQNNSKMQLGSAWWFCDHRDGMEEHMRILANLGMFPSFIGMLTDSRSFLSFVRHEYFRRIMCNLIGRWTENGEYPCDIQKLEKIVKDISFGNAKRYFEEL
jgi:glucuronate isomerase